MARSAAASPVRPRRLVRWKATTPRRLLGGRRWCVRVPDVAELLPGTVRLLLPDGQILALLGRHCGCARLLGLHSQGVASGLDRNVTFHHHIFDGEREIGDGQVAEEAG